MQMEQRVSRLEGAYEQVNERLNDLTQAVNSLRNSIFIMMGGMWVTTMGAIIGLYVTR